jgi:hypothetical protein
VHGAVRGMRRAVSTTYVPRKRRSVARTPWSYKDGGFDANVDGGQWLGALHAYLELPIAPRASLDVPARVPWIATTAQTRAWAERIDTALKTFRLSESYATGHGYLVAWRDFLRTCGGYDGR